MLSPGWGGSERNAFDMAIHLAQTERVEVCFAARKGSVAAERLGRADSKVELLTLPNFGKWDWRTRQSLLDLCLHFRPDVVHTHSNRASAIAGQMTRSFKATYVASLHGKYEPKNYRHLAHIIVATRVLDDYVRGNFEPDVTVHRLPIAVPPPARPTSLRRHEGFVIGAIGRLHPVKGYDFLLNAYARLRQSGPPRDVRLAVAGTGPVQDDLKAQAARLNIESHVAFSGWVHDPADFLSGIDLLIVPSRSESFGLTILEAAPFGLPVIATDTDGPRELLRADQLVPFGAVDQLVEKIKAAMADPARFRGPEGLDMKDYVEALIRIYRDAIDTAS